MSFLLCGRFPCQMIFYPIGYWGVPLKRWVLGSFYGCDVLQPLGLIGWQVSSRHPSPGPSAGLGTGL